MKNKVIKATHIDTGGHGYLSVSKNDFKLLGIPATEITGFSGHTPSRIYLEEDCDASTFMKYAELKGHKVEVKSGYNLSFSIKHNYKPELFAYTPRVGDTVVLSDDNQYKITEISKRIIVESVKTGMKYKISLTNPFEHIKGVIVNEPTIEDIDQEIAKAVKEQNHFYGFCCITNYYGKASAVRGETIEQQEEKGNIVYAYVKYGSPYNGGTEGKLLKLTQNYQNVRNKVATLADLRR